MAILIESLESRSLFAAGGLGGPLIEKAALLNDPAVQAAVALVRADVSAIEAARQKIVADSTDTRPPLKETIRAGIELIAADRKAIRDAKGDPSALAVAKAKLETDRQQIRNDLAAARDAFKADTTTGRAALTEATLSLREHLKQLRTDLRNASPPIAPTPALQQTTTGPTLSSESSPVSTITPPAPMVPVPSAVQPPVPAPAHAESEQPPSNADPAATPPVPTSVIVNPPPPSVAPEAKDAEPVAPMPPPGSTPTADASEGMSSTLPGWRQKPPLFSENSIHPSAEKVAATFDVALAVMQQFGSMPVDVALLHNLIDEHIASFQDRRIDPTEEAEFRANVNDVLVSAGLPAQPSEPRRQLGAVVMTLLLPMDPIEGTTPLPASLRD